MPKTIKTPSTVLVSLMKQYGLYPNQLAKDIGLSYSAVRLIALGNIKISASTALRLAKYFGSTPEYWLSLQQEADLLEAQKDRYLQSDLKRIKKAVKQVKKPAPARKGRPAAKVTRKKSVTGRKRRTASKTGK